LARLENEALTLEHLNPHVPGIPVPHVYKYSSTFDKEIGLPFILMDWVTGTLLADIWE